jgi:hypothetical protein
VSGGEWTTQRERKQNAADARELIRAQKRQLQIAWADSYWLAPEPPCGRQRAGLAERESAGGFENRRQSLEPGNAARSCGQAIAAPEG